jgi:hypothetical protein
MHYNKITNVFVTLYSGYLILIRLRNRPGHGLCECEITKDADTDKKIRTPNVLREVPWESRREGTTAIMLKRRSTQQHSPGGRNGPAAVKSETLHTDRRCLVGIPQTFHLRISLPRRL